jgi:hypothetical protein
MSGVGRMGQLLYLDAEVSEPRLLSFPQHHQPCRNHVQPYQAGREHALLWAAKQESNTPGVRRSEWRRRFGPFQIRS